MRRDKGRKKQFLGYSKIKRGKKRPAGERRGNLRALIHAESGRTQLCIPVSAMLRRFIAWPDRPGKITRPELYECLLLEKLIGRCPPLQFFQNLRSFPFVFFGVEIALVTQSLNILEAFRGSERGLAELTFLDVLTDRVQQNARASAFRQIVKTGSKCPKKTKSQKYRCTRSQTHLRPPPDQYPGDAGSGEPYSRQRPQ